MVSRQDLALTARGVLEKLNSLDEKVKLPLSRCLESKVLYQGKPMPYLMKAIHDAMCVSKNLLDKRRYRWFPKELLDHGRVLWLQKPNQRFFQWGWADGSIWSLKILERKKRGGKWGHLFQGSAQSWQLRSERVFDFSAKIERSDKITRWALKILTRESPFIPWHGNIGPINNISTYVSKSSRLTWTCIPMPAKSNNKAALVTTTGCYVGSSSHSSWQELMQLLTEGWNSTNPLAQSQGISVMPQVIRVAHK